MFVPAGRWVTGPIHLASNIHLHLAEGAELLFSQDFADYLPVVFSRWEGLELMNYSPLVYAKDCENVAITGKGKLDGRGQAWWPWKKTQKDAAKRLYDMASAGTPPEKRVFGTPGDLRPSFIQTVGCKNVLVEGVTISSGPMWTIHPVYSENVIVRRVTVLTDGPNNDGLNPDSSKNVLVEDSFFSTGDDCVVIKSGLNEDGWRVGRPSENIVVRRLRGQRGHGGVVIGSEMSGGVRNVFVNDCEFVGTDRGLRIKSMRGRGGVIENMYYQNVRHLDLRLLDVELTTFYGSSTLVPLTQKPPTDPRRAREEHHRQRREDGRRNRGSSRASHRGHHLRRRFDRERNRRSHRRCNERSLHEREDHAEDGQRLSHRKRAQRDARARVRRCAERVRRGHGRSQRRDPRGRRAARREELEAESKGVERAPPRSRHSSKAAPAAASP